MWGELTDGVAHDLSGTMKGHVSAALHLDDRHLTGQEHIRGGLSPTAQRIDWLVLQQKQGVADLPLDPGVEAGRHSGVCLGIAESTQPLDS
jgi:hypothetical protein